jgi:hypothetical protein
LLDPVRRRLRAKATLYLNNARKRHFFDGLDPLFVQMRA